MRIKQTLLRHFCVTRRNFTPGIDLVEAYGSLPFVPKSVLLLSAPWDLTSVSHQLKRLVSVHERLQVVTATLDSSHESCVSELWMDEPLKIEAFTLLNDEDTTIHKNSWEIMKCPLNIQFSNGVSSKLNISNSTIFYNEQLDSSMYFIDPHHDKSGLNLSSLSIKLPISINPNPMSHYSNLIKLKSEREESLFITKAQNNLIIELNRKSPSDILMNLLKESRLDSMVIEVFAIITNTETDISNTYKVVAGGGQWGNNSSTLVLENLDLGKKTTNNNMHRDEELKLHFSIVDPTRVDVFDPNQKGIWFENVDIEHIKSVNTTQPSVLHDSLLLGSTDGISIAGKSYNSVSELIGFISK